MINVMLADDHVLIREGIKQLLEFDGSMKVIAEASDGIECLEKLKNVKPDILLSAVPEAPLLPVSLHFGK